MPEAHKDLPKMTNLRSGSRSRPAALIATNKSFYEIPSEILIGGGPLFLKYWQKAYWANTGDSPGENT